MSKTELIDFVKHQTGIELIDDKSDILNRRRKTLYTKLSRTEYPTVARLLIKKGIRFESHLHDYYFINI